MAIVQSSLDWKCDESFLVSVAGRKLANSYTKQNTGDAICCQLITSTGASGPILISTVESNVLIDGYTSETVYSSTVYEKTWYIQKPNEWTTTGNTWYIPDITLSYCDDIDAFLSDTDNRSRIIRSILNEVGYTSSSNIIYKTLNSAIPSIVCDYSYIVKSVNRVISSHSGELKKTTEGAVLAFEYFYNNQYYGPVLISNTSPDYVKYTDSTTYYTFIAKGITWYMSRANGWNNTADSNRSVPIINGIHDISTEGGRISLLTHLFAMDILQLNSESASVPSVAFVKSYINAILKANNQKMKEYIASEIESVIFIGTADEYELARLNETVGPNTFVVITDRDSYDIDEIMYKLDTILDNING